VKEPLKKMIYNICLFVVCLMMLLVTDYIGSNDCMVVNNVLGEMSKEA
jgi:hypothetical protein